MPRAKKKTTQVSSTSDTALEQELQEPARPSLTDRLASVVGEATPTTAEPIKTGRKKKQPVPAPVIESEGPFTVSGCRVILGSLMEMFGRWAGVPLTQEYRLNEGAKLHAEVLNQYAPESWKEKAPLVMLGAWWSGVAIDVTAAKIQRTTKNPPPSTGTVVQQPTPQKKEIDINATRHEFKPAPGQTISG